MPDNIHAPSVELSKVTRNVYRKMAGSRVIGGELSLTGNRSHGFRVLLSGLRSLVGSYCIQ